MGEKVKGGLMITDSADWTDVRRRTGEGERQLSSIGQQLKEKCVCPRRTRMDTDGCPQADEGCDE